MPLRFTLRQLEYYVAVGECGTIALAAEKLHVSSPSISAAIAQLEAELGLQLFVRQHARGLSLTQSGRQIHEQARRILAEAEGLNRLAGAISGRVQGNLTLGCLLTFAQFVVPSLRRSFETIYPEVKISQAELDHQEIMARLRGGALDAALTYDLDIPDDLSFVPLAKLPPFVLLPAQHPLAAFKALTLAQLVDAPMILLDLPSSNDYFLSLFRQEGLRPNIAERARDIAVVRGLVGNGFGYSIANLRPQSALSPDGKPLVFVPLAGRVRPMVMGLLTVKGADNVLTIRALIDHCRQTVNERTMPGITPTAR